MSRRQRASCCKYLGANAIAVLSIADGGSHAFDRGQPNIAAGEHAGHARPFLIAAAFDLLAIGKVVVQRTNARDDSDVSSVQHQFLRDVRDLANASGLGGQRRVGGAADWFLRRRLPAFSVESAKKRMRQHAHIFVEAVDGSKSRCLGDTRKPCRCIADQTAYRSKASRHSISSDCNITACRSAPVPGKPDRPVPIPLPVPASLRPRRGSNRGGPGWPARFASTVASATTDRAWKIL